MGNWYSKEQFLFTFRFLDEPLVVPTLFLKDEDTYTKLCDNVSEHVRKGMRISKAFNACGIQKRTYETWLKGYKDELKANKSDTPLIRLFDNVYKADADLDKTLHALAMDRVLDGDEKMLHFLMKHRLGYNTQRTELELSNKGDTPFTVNIVGMTDTAAPKKDHPSAEEITAKNKPKDEIDEDKVLIDENGVLTKD